MPGEGLAQIFVWGEQPLPEVIELKQMAKAQRRHRSRREVVWVCAAPGSWLENTLPCGL